MGAQTIGDYDSDSEFDEEENEEEQKRLRDKFELFRDEFTVSQESSREDREESLNDRRFTLVPGGQWEDTTDKGKSLCGQYENKPKFEVNKCVLAVRRIYNEYAANRIGVDFVSKDGKKADDLSELCDGLLRADEYDSNAGEAYDNAFKDGVAGGIAGWRYSTYYLDDTDPDDERQRVMIEPLYDVESSVYFSPDAKGIDKTLAKRMYIIQPYPKYEFEQEWGDVPDVEKQVDSKEFDWVVDEVVYVAEVFELEEESYEIHTWETMDGEKRYHYTKEESQEKRKMLLATEHKLKKKRRIKRRVVHKYLMCGDRILEYCGIIPGDRQPVAMFYGDLSVVENKERTTGQTTWAKDIQLLKNMQISNLASLSSKGQEEVPILFSSQVIRHKKMWEEQNINDPPYLLIDPVEDSNGNMAYQNINYTRSPQVPPAMAALLNLTETDMKEILGNHQQGEEVVGNISTETAMLTQNRLDMQSYGYLSNFAKAMEQGGRIWLGIMRDIAVNEDYETKTINENKEVSSVRMNYVARDENGADVRKNDLSRAKLDVMSSVGPSSKSARNAVFRNLSNLIGKTGDQDTDKVLTAATLMNIDGEKEVTDIRKYFRKMLVGMGVVPPTPEEEREMEERSQNQQKTAEEQYLEAESTKSLAQAAESQSDVMLNQAKIDELRAKTAKLINDANLENQQALMNAIEKLGPRMMTPGLPGYPVQGQ